MVNVNAQQWLNEKYPFDGTCQRNSDQKNKGKKRAEITELDISKGNLGKHFYSIGDGNKNLVGSLKLEGFINLRVLNCSGHELINLDISDCPNLEELDCHNNQLNNLNVNGCSNLEKIDCSNNNSLKELDLSTCSKLKEVNINNCFRLSENTIRSRLFYDDENNKLIKSSSQIITAGENDIRNILIIGITGSGKSALANVLAETNQFKESASSTSATKSFQVSEIFEWEKDGKKIKYRAIDNIGFGDTNDISEESILFEIGKGIHAAKEGINQVLFVFKGRFSPEHVMAFNRFKNFIAGSSIARVTTIVRTNFPYFKNLQKCEEDKKSLLNENKELSEIIRLCNNVIYVDNPSLPAVDEDDSEEEGWAKISKEKREKSREKVLTHLAENCLEIYKLKKWDSLYAMVDSYIKRKEEIEKSDSLAKDEELKALKTEAVQGIKKELEVSIGVNILGLPFGSNNSAFKYKTN